MHFTLVNNTVRNADFLVAAAININWNTYTQISSAYLQSTIYNKKLHKTTLNYHLWDNDQYQVFR